MRFNEPTNYKEFRQNARDQDNIGVWQSIKDEPYISRRFGLKKYMGWTEDEIVENEKMVLEERFDPKDAADFAELGGGAGGGFGGGFGGGLPGGGLGLGPGVGDLGGAGGEFGDLGGDMGGGAMGGAAGVAPVGAGMGESEMTIGRTRLAEAPVTSADLKPAPRAIDDAGSAQTPNDDLFPVGADVEDHPDFVRDGGFKISLSLLQKVRKSQLTRRVENSKRMKMIQKVYQTPPDDMGGLGGMGGGMGGGLGGL
jgi:hypothetical protein